MSVSKCLPAIVLGLMIALTAGDASARGATTSESCLPGSLKSRLGQMRKTFGRIEVVSTHRPGARINGSGKTSYHANCRAVDFVPP
jgi:uncharacterized protein YcbK (DUF882 family)